MPYAWSEPTPAPDAPRLRLSLWPHQSLSPEGFVTFIALTCVMLSMPILAVLGTVVLWGILPFLVGAVAFVWLALRRSQRDLRLREDLVLWTDRIELVRTNPRGPAQCWQANPYWVQVHLHRKGGPVENYVTLAGAGREVEIGAFLSADERVDLYRDLTDRLALLRGRDPAS